MPHHDNCESYTWPVVAGTDPLGDLFDIAQIAAVLLDPELSVRSYTPAIAAIFDLLPTDLGRSITDIAHQLESVDLESEIRGAMDRCSTVEHLVRMQDGKGFHLMRIVPRRIGNSPVDGVLITFVNVTPVVTAQEQQRLRLAELNHRVRNMLQVVMGLASQTLHRSADLQQFERAFLGRMQALARAYELLSRDGWDKVSVGEVLRIQLSAFATEGYRYSADGQPIILRSNAALSLGLVLYELATNATKYGALSVPTGHVHVRWHCQARLDGGEEFILEWLESGGPAVKAPTRHGFGSELVHRQLQYELNGRASMEFPESGIVVTLVIPAEEAVESNAANGEVT